MAFQVRVRNERDKMTFLEQDIFPKLQKTGIASLQFTQPLATDSYGNRYSVSLVRRCSARTGGAALVFVKTKKDPQGINKPEKHLLEFSDHLWLPVVIRKALLGYKKPTC